MAREGQKIPAEALSEPEIPQGADWLLQCFQELRRSRSGDNPITIHDVLAWLDLHEFASPVTRQHCWKVVRSLDDWQLKQWAENRPKPGQNSAED